MMSFFRLGDHVILVFDLLWIIDSVLLMNLYTISFKAMPSSFRVVGRSTLLDE